MRYFLRQPLLHTLIAFGGFIGLTYYTNHITALRATPEHDRVVIASPVLTVLYGGDRFLGANLETIRLSATGIDNGRIDNFYLIRAHKVVSELNPCHENNYYLANALLSWGGAVDEGGEILERAALCRYWDELPPFLYGFNQFFFNRNVPEAQRWLEVAAQRAEQNADGFRNFAIMIEVEQVEDEKIALDMLRRERGSAESPKLAAMLDRRIARLEGLALLRDAQRRFEAKTGRPLSNPNELLTTGILEKFPNDPMRIGYEFADGRFRLKKVRVAGIEDR